MIFARKQSSQSISFVLRTALLLSVQITAILLFLRADWALIAGVNHQGVGFDWAPIWAATRFAFSNPESIYDFARVTAVQSQVVADFGTIRPYVYPPSALLIFGPFATLPFTMSWATFTATTAALFAYAARRLGAPWWTLISPVIVLPALVGQTTYLVGASIAAALLVLPRRPIMAGILLGAATVIKPSILVLVPLALVAVGNWQIIYAWATSCLAAFIATSLLLGPAIWLEWLQSLDAFQTVFSTNPGLVSKSITPYAHVGPGALIIAAPVAFALTWLAFRRPASPSVRMIALLAGGLLVSPYAMNYELALLAPALASLWARSVFGALALTAFAFAFYFGFGLVALCLAISSVILVAATSIRSSAQGAGEGPARFFAAAFRH